MEVAHDTVVVMASRLEGHRYLQQKTVLEVAVGMTEDHQSSKASSCVVELGPWVVVVVE